MTTQDSTVPLVFISYSHDSPEHKRWVAMLAEQLVQNGVDVRLDQWDVRFGDDLPRFMEKSVREADHVLMICTDIYVRKSNDRQGGVGYEAMIVTGELVQELGSSKFIPVLRQTGSKLPASVSTRMYCDLSEDESYNENFDRLLREIHKAPVTPKPSLGSNPFRAQLVDASATPSHTSTQALGPAAARENPSSTPTESKDWYLRGRTVAIGGDMGRWRSLVTIANESVEPQLAEWWKRYGGRRPTIEGLVPESLEGLGAFEPLIGLALAAIGTGVPKFNRQIDLLERIVMPPTWSPGGLVVRIELPHAGAFIYQALHGALCLHTQQLKTAMDLVREAVKLPSWGKPRPIYEVPEFVGWPQSFGESTAGWKVLTEMPNHWKWLLDVFGSHADYKCALVAYYMGLCLNEFSQALNSNREINAVRSGETPMMSLPTHFVSTSDEIRRRAYRLLTEEPCHVCNVWRSLRVTDARAKEKWAAWLSLYGQWHQTTYRFSSSNPFGDFDRLIEHAVERCPKA